MLTKIFNIFLLFICYICYPFKKRDTNLKKDKKILIIQRAKLGDMVCTTPMFRAVKEKFPKSELIVMGNNTNKYVLENNYDVDRYFVIKNETFWENFKIIKKIKPDFACITSPTFINLAALYLASVPIISAPKIENGESPYETKAYKQLINYVIAIKHRMGSYAPREYLKLLEPIGIYSEDTKKYLGYSSVADSRIKDFFNEKKIKKDDFIVGVSPSAGNKIKKWPEEKFAKVVDYLYKKYKIRIIIIGGKDDKGEILKMLSFLDKNTKVLNTCEDFNIDELKALISRMDMFISVDTGPIYIAEAFGVPTIDITGPIDEKEQPPIGEYHKVVFIKNRKRPQLYVMNARNYDYKEARRQTEEITTEMVIDIFEDLYGKIKK